MTPDNNSRVQKTFRAITICAILVFCIIILQNVEARKDAANSPRTMNVTVMSYNLRCSLCDLEYPWGQRLRAFKDIFARNEIDLLGAQELTFPWEVTDILNILPGGPAVWDAVYFQSFDGYLDDPDATLFYRNDTFRLVDHGFYWLSPTPDTPLSRGCSSHQVAPRLLNWGLFIHLASQQSFYFATTHFDNNQPCQPFSARLLKSRGWPWSFMLPMIQTGDFNSDWSTEAFKTLTTPSEEDDGFYLTETFSLAKSWKIRTNVSPPPAYNPKESIDHVFVNSTTSLTHSVWQVSDWFVDMYQYPHAKQLYPSDHWPVSSVIQLTSN